MLLPSLADIHLVETIHHGAKCRVHRGRRGDSTPVCVKELWIDRPEPAQIAWFRREYEVQRRLDLPCVVKAYALESHGWTWAMILEDFGGISLDRLLLTRAFSLAERLTIATSAAMALGELHARNVIHKDITPANLVWNPETGVLKIIDLGISTLLPRETPAMRSPEALEGTLRYLSPEQTGRVNRPVDYRSDFYALGATLYELFTGAPPFSSDDPMELVHAHIARRPVSPRDRDGTIPLAVSAVIVKLLAKTPEARYQSSYGLIWDLEQCAARAAAGDDGPFEPGTHDLTERFRVPGELYGREPEQRALLEAFEDTASAGKDGRDALVLVTGYAGVGKSTLVRELYEPTTRWRGYFVAGKFEQLERSRPYSALLDAFGSLTRQLLGESERGLADLRQRLVAALGSNGRVVTDLVPELELILGPQPPLADLGPTEAQNRFNAVFRSFIRVFARPSHPLVLFLDDLQWADLGSLKLLELLFQDESPHCLFVIGAYRDHETGPAHPLLLTVGALERAGVLIRRIPLSPLGLPDVTRLVADTVGRPAEEVSELAGLVAQKTEGNPLFVVELLRSLYDDGLLDFDRAAGRWRWDVARIAARGVSASVVDLMVGKLRRLPEETQRAVELAACLGGSFDVDTLSASLEVSVLEAFRRLVPAVRGGFLATTSELVVADAGAADSPFVIRHFKFVHDRIQQAAYHLIPEGERSRVHLRVGRLLLRRGGSGRDEERFLVVDQLNRGVRLVEGRERLDLARLNLDAGLRARRALAYTAARSYLEAGIACLSDAAWEEDYELAFALRRELAETASLTGDHDRSEAIAKEALERARTPIDRAELYVALVYGSAARGRYREALAHAKVGLDPLGVHLPLDLSDDELARSLPAELAEVDRQLGGRPIGSLLSAPEMADPAARTITSLLLKIFVPAFFVSSTLYTVIACKAVAMLLKEGPSPRCVDLFSNYGHITGALRGDHQTAYAFGKLAVDLSARFNRPDCQCRSAYHLGNWISPLSRPLRETEAWNEMAFRAGLDGGELLYTGIALAWRALDRYHEGRSLDEVAATVTEVQAWNRRMGNQISADILLALDLVLDNARGVTASAAEWRSRDHDEASFVSACLSRSSEQAVDAYYLLKEELLYVYGDFPGALAAHAEAEALLSTNLGWYGIAYHVLYEALALAALHPRASAEEQARTRLVLDAAAARFEGLAASCPENYAHLRALLLGEVARLDGRPSEAADLYEQALTGARREGFTHHVAIAAEAAARLWLQRGHRHVAASYMQDALHAYKIRGLARKVALLEEQHPDLLHGAEAHRESRPDDRLTAKQRRRESSNSRSSPAATGTGLLDLTSVLKASQALSSEIVIDRLLDKLLQIVLENAGARSGALILDRGGELVVAVDARVDDAGPGAAIVGALRSIPIGSYEDASEEIIRYVARTREAVILSDAAHLGGHVGGHAADSAGGRSGGALSFARTPYVARRRPKSVLCTAVVSQGRLLAVLYMENNLTTAAFTEERIQVLGMLSAQIAISLDNALLYHEIEERVRQRTIELSQRNSELHEAIAHLRTTQTQLVQSAKMASLGRLTTGIAHELKNPLNFVSNFAALDLDLCDELAETARQHPETRLADVRDALADLRSNAEKIRQHGKRANDIVQTMVKHSGGGAGEPRPIDINALVNDFVRVAQDSARAQPVSPIRIEGEFDAQVRRLTVLPQDLGRVIVTLCDNAIEAVAARSHAEGPAYEPVIRAGTRRSGAAVQIFIQDNGGGIPEKIRDRVFEPFFTTKPTGTGTGLGLSLSYDIVVNGHGGTLTFDTVEGEGTTFVIALPAPADPGPADRPRGAGPG